ncbi:MAG: hypothetical protein KGJ23_12760 [Euryarchaeota archaeon]|nr:hypothetical protein [Euryarchaeota archaeon]MDE2045564.1 hypothetical protein [Thermoplasmata archaeon]
MSVEIPPASYTERAPLGWRGALRIAEVVYDEFSFQSIYALKQGNSSVYLEGKRGEGAVERARRRVAQSKAMVAFLLFMVISVGAIGLRTGAGGLGLTLTPVDYATSLVAGELLLIFSLLWMTGLQVAPTLLGSKVFPLLATLPLSQRDMRRVGFIVFLRIFDAPALMATFYLPLAVGLATGSVLAALVLLPGTIITVALSCAISLVTARFFLLRVSGAEGGTPGSLALRWVYLLLWSLPSLAITAFVAFSLQILDVLSFWEASNPGAFRTMLLLYPFPFAYLTSLAIYPSLDIYHLLSAPVMWLSVALYAAAAAVSVHWLRRAPVDLSLAVPRSSRGRRAGDSEVRTDSPSVAILHKDLRIASRTPGYAFLILLPLLDAFILGLSTMLSHPDPAQAERFAIAAVTVAAMLATFFGPAFFATEVMGFSFTRTLPIPRRTLLWGKASLILLVYVIASLLVMGLVAARIGNPIPFAIFALAELPGVLAASFFELGVLFHKAEKTGIPVVNLYSGAWWAMLVVFPGLLVAGIPLLLYLLGQNYDRALAVPSMVVSALLLLVATAAWALWGGRGATEA